MDDRELLLQYASNSSSEAFAKLARRYAGLVYSAARRQLGDSHLADDVTQAVFILLTKKAGGIRGPLGGWLIKTTYFACRDARKLATRRQLHERRAAEMRNENSASQPQSAWEDYAPYLDQALARLNAQERDAVVLRHMQGMSYTQAAVVMGISEEAARKRADRGLARLRESMTGKMDLPATAVLATQLASRAVEAAPTEIIAKIGLSATTAGGKTFASAIASKTAISMLISKFKMAAVFLIVIGAGGAVSGAAFKILSQTPATPAVALAAPVAAPAMPMPASQPSQNGEVLQVLRYGVLLTDDGWNAIKQINPQSVPTRSKLFTAMICDTASLHSALSQLTGGAGVEAMSTLHGYDAALWTVAAQGNVRLGFDETAESGFPSLQGKGPGSIHSRLIDADHRALTLDFPTVEITLKEAANASKKVTGSVVYDGVLSAGQSLIFLADIPGSAGRTHHELAIWETIKAADWQMKYFALANDLHNYLDSGPEAVQSMANQAIVWAASAKHNDEEASPRFTQTLPDGKIIRLTGRCRMDKWPFCWWDGDGQPVDAYQDMPINPQYEHDAADFHLEMICPAEERGLLTPLNRSSAATQPGEMRIHQTIRFTSDSDTMSIWVNSGPWKQIGNLQVGGSITVNGITYQLQGISQVASKQFEPELTPDKKDGDAITLTAVLNDGTEVDPYFYDGVLGSGNYNWEPVFSNIAPAQVKLYHVWQRKRIRVKFPAFPAAPAQEPRMDVSDEEVSAAVATMAQRERADATRPAN